MKPVPSQLRSLLVMLSSAMLGIIVAVQTRVNGEFSAQSGNSLLAALTSFGVGFTFLLIWYPISAPMRNGLRRIFAAVRNGSTAPWYLVGGPLGAIYAISQAAITPLIGVASFTVGVVGGTVIGGMLVDARGVGPSGVIAITRQRLIGLCLVIVGIFLAFLPELSFGGSLSLILVSVGVGLCSALQSAVNGRVAFVSENIAAATLLNFGLGTLLLAVITSLSFTINGLPTTLPSHPLLYTAGLMGTIVIGATSLLVRYGGVLLVGISNVAGLMVGSILVDFVVPFAAAPSLELIIGAGIILGAAAITTLPSPTARSPRSS